MTHVTCRLTAKNRDQLRNPTLGNRVWATSTFLYLIWSRIPTAAVLWTRPLVSICVSTLTCLSPLCLNSYIQLYHALSVYLVLVGVEVWTSIQLYHALGVYLVLVGVEIWTSGDLISVDAADYSATLGNFCDYRTNYINAFKNNDNAQLITYIESFSEISAILSICCCVKSCCQV